MTNVACIVIKDRICVEYTHLSFMPCGGAGCNNATTVFPLDCKKETKKDGTRGLGSPYSVFSPMKRQNAEGEEIVMSPLTLNTLSWLHHLRGI